MYIIYNSRGYSKFYSSSNKEWKHLKFLIKSILDGTDSCKLIKINQIICLLEHYKSTYLKGDDDK